MKSEHRHDLQTNELGKVADRVASSFGGFFEQYGNYLMIGFCVVALGAAALIVKFRMDNRKEADAWRDLAAARNPEELKRVWEGHPGTKAAEWARVQQAEQSLSEGVRLSFTQLEAGRKELEEARSILKEVADRSGAPPEMRERTLLALARCQEALSDGNVDEAVKSYQNLLREFPQTIYKKDAEQRIDILKSGSGQEFYSWFASFARPKPSESLPRDRTGGSDLDLPFKDDKDIPDNTTAPGDAPLDAPADDAQAPEKEAAPEKSAPEKSDKEPASTESPPAEQPKSP